MEIEGLIDVNGEQISIGDTVEILILQDDSNDNLSRDEYPLPPTIQSRVGVIKISNCGQYILKVVSDNYPSEPLGTNPRNWISVYEFNDDEFREYIDSEHLDSMIEKYKLNTFNESPFPIERIFEYIRKVNNNKNDKQMTIKPMPTAAALQKFAKEIYKGNSENGFWDNPRSSDQITMLIKSEVFEAMECWRNRQDIDKGLFCSLFEYTEQRIKDNLEPFDAQTKGDFKALFKETKEVEIADAIIRVLDTMAHFNIPFLELEKMPVADKETINPYIHIDKLLNSLYDTNFGKESAITFAVILSNLFSYDENLMEYAKVKVLYNKTREKMHGNKRA